MKDISLDAELLHLVETAWNQLAHQLRHKTLDLISRNSDIYEYYHPESGDPPPKAASTFGWSAAIFIDLAIQAAQDGRI